MTIALLFLLVLYPAPKLFTREPEIRYHPSTKTKNISLKGSETIIGGTIIIPIDINIEATTISIMTNGK